MCSINDLLILQVFLKGNKQEITLINIFAMLTDDVKNKLSYQTIFDDDTIISYKMMAVSDFLLGLLFCSAGVIIAHTCTKIVNTIFFLRSCSKFI